MFNPEVQHVARQSPLWEDYKNMRSIAKSLGRSPSSSSREVRRNSPAVRAVKYRGNRAQKRAEDRSRCRGAKERLADPFVRDYVEYHLANDGWKPEEIAGRLSADYPGLKTNYESIYLWIYTERRGFINCLVRAHKKRHKRSSGKVLRKTKIPGRVDRDQGPSGIESREEAGMGRQARLFSAISKAAAAVFVEGKTRRYTSH